MEFIDYTLKEICKLDKKTKLNAIRILNNSMDIEEFFKDFDKQYEKIRFKKFLMEKCCENCKYYRAKDGKCPCRSCNGENFFAVNDLGIDFMIEEED